MVSSQPTKTKNIKMSDLLKKADGKLIRLPEDDPPIDESELPF